MKKTKTQKQIQEIPVPVMRKKKEKVDCKKCKWHKVSICEKFDSPDAINLTAETKDAECSEFEPTQPQEEWEKEFDNTYDGKFHSAWFVKEDWLVIYKKDIIDFIKNLATEIRKEERGKCKN